MKFEQDEGLHQILKKPGEDAAELLGSWAKQNQSVKERQLEQASAGCKLTKHNKETLKLQTTSVVVVEHGGREPFRG